MSEASEGTAMICNACQKPSETFKATWYRGGEGPAFGLLSTCHLAGVKAVWSHQLPTGAGQEETR